MTPPLSLLLAAIEADACRADQIAPDARAIDLANLRVILDDWQAGRLRIEGGHLIDDYSRAPGKR